MAIFLGAVALNGEPLADSLTQTLGAALAPAGAIQVKADGPCAIAYVDMGLWPGQSTRATPTSFGIVAADPVLCEGARGLPRSEGIDRLMQRLPDEGSTALRDAEGSYAGARWDNAKGELLAFTDKMGVRPLYWAKVNNHLYFASAFWALHAVLDLGLSPNWRAAAETAAFGFPLGNRTLADPINVLAPGHCLRAGSTGLADDCYWDWRQLPVLDFAGDQLLDHVERAFHDAMDRRMQGQSRVMAFLSGGMDSRLIAARLRERGLDVHSLNFAPPGSQDLVFGKLVAERLGCKHFEYSQGALDFGMRQTEALQAWRLANPNAADQPDQPGLIWSGDGGSVGLGHVYLTSKAVRLARSEGLLAAAKCMQADNKNFLSPRILRSAWRALAEAPLQGIVEDLTSRSEQVEPGRNCHLFFMLNDQRRHLVKHFETLHLRRVDLVLPFFDGRFIGAVLRTPVDEFLEHRLYNALMARLPMGAGQVPWQAYPGHQPCPIPIDSNLRRQWQDGWFDKADARSIRYALLKKTLRQLVGSGSATEVVARPTMAAVMGLCLTGLGKYLYLVESCQPFLSAADLARQRQA